jgi:NAD+ diphosphatase
MAERFAGARIDRAAERRTDGPWLAERRADRASRAVAVTERGVVLDPSDDGRLARFALADVGISATGAPEAVLLGLQDGAALFATELPGPPDGHEAVGLRRAAAALAAPEAALAAHAVALLTWHRTHPHCARCGAPTDLADAGYLRRCARCGAEHHPRTDAVVIMLVTDGDRALLGRQRSWPPGFYSALAGFVEPGESLEEAVGREVLEEAGVEIRAPRYVASQPWPFPASLMLGFLAEHAGGEPDARDGELEDARWFTRAELAEAVAGRGDVHVPPPLAIARTLIDRWLAQ